MARVDRLDERAEGGAAPRGGHRAQLLLPRAARRRRGRPGAGPAPGRAAGRGADPREAGGARAGVHLQARAGAGGHLREHPAGEAAGAARPRGPGRSRPCSPTGWKSSTACWPITMPGPRPGRRPRPICSRRATRPGAMAADAEALAHYQQAMAAYARAFGDRWDPLQRAALERKMGEALFRRGNHDRRTNTSSGRWPAWAVHCRRRAGGPAGPSRGRWPSKWHIVSCPACLSGLPEGRSIRLLRRRSVSSAR